MAGRVPVSVTVVTFNEEKNLGRCLASVRWAEEILVVDSGSTDGTVELARRHGARVVDHPWEGYTAQKNRAAAEARQAWVLSLDADEWLPEGAGDEIARVIREDRHAAFALLRLSAFAGGFLPRTWGGDRPIRLYRKEAARFEGAHVHESVAVRPGFSVGRIVSPLFHLTHRSVRDQVERFNRYSDLASRRSHEEGRRFSLLRLLTAPPAAFVKMFVLKGGALDGVRGLVTAVDHAHYVFLKSAKLWDRTREPEPGFVRRVPPTPEDPDPGAPYSG